jgi:hypothetical protein
MKNIIMKGGKMNNQKGGYRGSEMWSAHRLEGATKNLAIKSIRKPKSIIKKTKNILDKKISHMI